MLCPEIWDFKAPEHHFEIERASYRTEEVPLAVSTHYFNHSVSIVLPDIKDVPPSLRDCLLEDSDYYKIVGLKAHELVNKEFIEAFVKKGELTLLTIGKKIDVHNLICISPTGHLLLSLLREDYQKLGLVGKETFFDRKAHSRYVVTINLNEEAFVPGKKNYERVRSCLQENLDESFDVVVAWDPPEDKLCPSSVAAWFHDRGYTTLLCNQVFKQRIERSIFVPNLDGSSNLDEFFEWLGIFSIGGDTTNEKEDDYVNTYTCPRPKTQTVETQYIECTGFFTRKQIIGIYNAMREIAFQKDTSPWKSIHVQGFADSPVSWGLKEHNFFTDGDNSHTTVFQKNGECIIRKSLSSNKKPRIFQ
ncbi:ribonuclease P protein subunit p40-like [Venturia canescens]|uniref:ribonuclease P protein subunit p40-like n=1 Tax=Venturia canescens TaxID=32260 RepID=UPI001C9D23D9|nr:ribonuclease P protein subunit p40-like [Venturia canescens]